MRTFFLILLFPFASIAQNTVCFNIEANPYPNDPALNQFTKYVDVYGFEIFGEDGATDVQVLHVAAVTAELLDNDEDGNIDDQPLLNQLLGNGALMPIFNFDGSPAMNAFENNYTGDGVSAVLYANEVDPNNPGHWGDDATVEEVLHTINHRGHIEMYPFIFGIDPNSSTMSAAMDTARGGQWLTIPNPYPAEAWYHYNDQTCDYGCMAVEYMYWCIVSHMGILDDPQTCAGIADEWEPCTPALFQSTDVAMYALITDPQYKIPQNAPDGNYCPPGMSIEETEKNELKVYPNPSSGSIQVELDAPELIQVFTSDGKLVISKAGGKGVNRLDIQPLKAGTYLVITNSASATFVVD